MTASQIRQRRHLLEVERARAEAAVDRARQELTALQARCAHARASVYPGTCPDCKKPLSPSEYAEARGASA